MTPGNFRTIVVLVAMSFLAGAPGASASVLDVFSVSPDPVVAGRSAALDLQLTLVADPGYFNAQITGGSVTFSSGFGTSDTIAIAGNSTFADASATFTYADVGNYSPGFSAIVDYAEEYTALGVVGYRSVILDYYIAIVGAYRCGLSICYERAALPEYGSIPEYGDYTVSSTNQQTLTGSADLIVTPVPATLPLLGAGIGALGLLGWRQKRRARSFTP